MSHKYNVSCPSGFPEWTPAQERVQQDWIRVITEVFEANGFMPITTPMVEREENLVAKGGDPKEVYVLKRLLDEDGDTSHSGNALRFDHTVPLALYVARHLNDIAFPFKRYSIGPVFRGERAQKGRYRQFTQCDIDVIGSGEVSLLNDAQMVAIIVQIFERLNIGKFKVRINNRKILTGLFRSLGVDAGKIKSTLDHIDDLEKIGLKKVTEALTKDGLTNAQVKAIVDFTKISGRNDDILAQLEEHVSGEEYEEGVRSLKMVVDGLRSMDISNEQCQVDLAIARGLDYYTGTVYETNLLNEKGDINTSLGSICSGGRYDDLAEIFTGKKLPGVGISIGLTRLLAQLFDAGIVKTDRSSPTDVLVIAMSSDVLSQALEIGTKIRGFGYKTENYLENKKVGKQFDYANKLGIPVCVVIGEDEVKNGDEVQRKDMRDGQQRKVKISDLQNDLDALLC